MERFKSTTADNIAYLESALRMDKNYDILERKASFCGKEAGLFFIDGFVREEVIEKLMEFFYGLDEKAISDPDTFLITAMPYTEAEKIYDVKDAIKQFMAGVTLCFIDGFDCCIAIDCRTYPMRSVTEPWKDKVLRGSRDGFVETMVNNAALIRRRIRDTRLSFEMFEVGESSKTDVCVSYIEGKAPMELVEQIKRQIKSIKVESLTMNIESLAECMYVHKWIDPFPKFKYSERPDTASAALLDGNVILMVDNSPAVMIMPTTIFDIVEEPDDYTFSPVVGTYLRWSKFLFTIVTFILTPLWLYLVNEPEVIPEWLKFITVSDEIKVPVFLQLIILEFAVDGLKVAAVNTPDLLSTPLSIIAGIVVGEYAVSSGWFNPESLLYMAVVTVGTYSQSSFEFGYALKFFRIFTLVITQIFGLAGLIVGVVVTLLCAGFNHTVSGRSYVYPLLPFEWDKLKRKLMRIRLPHENM